jgi:hypothetical protein
MKTTHVLLTVLGVILFLLLGGLGLWGCPTYNVWQQGLAGKAELKRAE